MTLHQVSPAPLSLTRGLRLRSRKALVWGVVLALGLVAADYAVGVYQRAAVEEKKAARARLERMALFNLRADIEDFAMPRGNQYRLTLKLDNPFPEKDFYVMTPEVQVYIQEGTVWREVPSRPAMPGSQGSVVKLTGLSTYEHVFEATVRKFEELIPGYMHVRIRNVMYVSPRGDPKPEEIVERVDNYYVYLKPHGVSDREILKKNQFPGGKVPLWIPMPPH